MSSYGYLKLENLQKTGSFKLRGAANALLRLSGSKKTKGVLAFSTGNHIAGILSGGNMDRKIVLNILSGRGIVNMMYQQKNMQVSYGEAIGILLLDSPVPFIPGDVANATTYNFPIRFKKVPGFSVKKALGKEESIYPELLKAAMDLKANGVRAITGDCGFMALHQKRLKQDLKIPVFLSSLFQIPFIRHLKADNEKIGIITADAQSLTPSFLEAIGIQQKLDLVVEGLENCPEFKSAVLDEKGSLDSKKIQEEVVQAAINLTAKENLVKIILLECSVLPPYAQAIQKACALPVFDYITMINYVFNAVVKKTYKGFM